MKILDKIMTKKEICRMHEIFLLASTPHYVYKHFGEEGFLSKISKNFTSKEILDILEDKIKSCNSMDDLPLVYLFLLSLCLKPQKEYLYRLKNINANHIWWFKEFKFMVLTSKMIESGRKCHQKKPTVITQYVSKYIGKDKTILDFGAGKNAVQTKILRKKGFNVVAYDLFENQTYDLHDSLALDKKYDIVMVSNVLNVQSSTNDIIDIIVKIKGLLNNNGIALFNYPKSPRYANISMEKIEELLMYSFFNSKRISAKLTKGTVIFECKNN